ncbi:siderophore-interacting protein [Rhodococcus sp. NPDC060090]|uniref:siderophore-interacting protein n=1 Tax=Rhodococcus sp. NPDC060090 TaxID=3347056 RepID=UPI00365DD9E3
MTCRTEITEHYLRIGFADGGLLAEHPVHRTMWIRMWFPDGDRVHQRGYTLVNIDVDAGTFDVDFPIHDGSAARWALAAKPGETIGATVTGSKFTLNISSVQFLYIQAACRDNNCTLDRIRRPV